MTLSEWLDRWLEQMSLTLRPDTLKRYRGDMDRHVKPYLGHKKLTQITAEDLRELYHTLQERGRISPRPGQGPGLSPATVRGIHAALHQALQAAADQCLIPNNPAKQVDPPKITHKPMKILNEEQMDTFLAAVDGNEIWRDFFYTELTTGLRLGEICGLMWSDFDGRKGILSVTRTLRKEKGGGWWSGTPRPMPGLGRSPPAVQHSEAADRAQKALLLPLDFPQSPSPRDSAESRRRIPSVEENSEGGGLPGIRFHDLRHTFATPGPGLRGGRQDPGRHPGPHQGQLYPGHLHPYHGGYAETGAEIVGGFLTDYLGEEMAPWQSAENAGTAAST